MIITSPYKMLHLYSMREKSSENTQIYPRNMECASDVQRGKKLLSLHIETV